MTFAQKEELGILRQLPKAELHLHLEGCLTPKLLVSLAEKRGEKLAHSKVAKRYHTRTFSAFLDLFKWTTSYLHSPEDYAHVAEISALYLHAQNCVYAEITLSVGVMLLRKQDVAANFSAILRAIEKTPKPQPRIRWIFDAVRQFGPDKAMDVARLAVQMKSAGVVALGLGGDENSLPASDFQRVYDYAAAEGLRRVVHAGEVGGPESVRDAIEILGAERVGHGIAAIRDEKLMDLLIARHIPLEICPKSNLCTGALAKLLGVKKARIEDHPLPEFVARGVPVTLASDDPAMFRTSLNKEYLQAAPRMGLSLAQLVAIAEAGFRHSFLPSLEKQAMREHFRAQARNISLL